MMSYWVIEQHVSGLGVECVCTGVIVHTDASNCKYVSHTSVLVVQMVQMHALINDFTKMSALLQSMTTQAVDTKIVRL